MPLDWNALLGQMNAMQRLTHFAARWGFIKEEQLRVQLLSVRRKAYEAELGTQAGNVGCAGRAGRLTNDSITGLLNEASNRDAQSISNTFNYFLAVEILRAGETNPRGGPLYYARTISAWAPTYWQWKYPQITQVAELTARAMAQQDFYRINGAALGSAKLEPQSAVCPVCLGWIARGAVPLRVALAAPPPYHPNCPHIFQITAKHVAKEDCPLLWMGA